MVIDPVLVLKGRGERNIARTVIIMATAQVLNLNQLEVLYMLGGGEIQSDTGGLHLSSLLSLFLVFLFGASVLHCLFSIMM